MSHLVIVGGSDAGISAALRARELDTRVQITMIVEDAFPNYSICGLPFYLSGEVPDYHQLAHRTREEITGAGIDLLLDHTAQAIGPEAHHVTVVDGAKQTQQIAYDRLILATGAKSRRPLIGGMDLPGVFPLHTMESSFQMQHYLQASSPRSALIIGGGYIGLEMADALTRRGLSVTLIEHGASVLKTVDPSLGTLVQAELWRQGVAVHTGIQVQQIATQQEHLCVSGTGGFEAHADIVLVAVGVEPRAELAQAIGAELGTQGAVRVSRTMATSVPDVFAAGDCVETWHRVLQGPTYLPLGTTAHKQGRIAGETVVGGERLFAGTLGTQVVKVFDLAIARTGLREHEARAAGFDPLTIEGTYLDHKVYYPGAQTVHLRLTADRRTGRLLGAQMVGSVQTEVAKRIDTLATALFHTMTVEALSDLDLSYTPPLGSPWDLMQMCAQQWSQTNVHREQQTERRA
ncbi:CoA-disulfide reductase [Ktedonosporobacter rubrisoli]|uniref:CoA-disulfide reductase n=1 Tax=Ktedonosporobacter rubrisoli TaxID=2509675 RepID=A0A4P6K3D8_KTERU|nr:FAD-dependent oxidoreductase [Ktedonosporobacter rubrisoli]QBD82767.1 CoA-disulfide reductase [Ktedonosporobacter rubrisoli]